MRRPCLGDDTLDVSPLPCGRRCDEERRHDRHEPHTRQWVDAIYQERPQSYGSDVDDWSGWIAFAGVVMMVLGGFGVIEGPGTHSS